VTRDEDWIGKRIYWRFKQSHLVTQSKDHCRYSTYEVFSVFISRCLVAAFNGGRCRSSGFPNCPQVQLPASHFSQLKLSTWHGLHRKRLFHYCVFSRCRGNNVSTELFPSNGCCIVACLHRCIFSIYYMNRNHHTGDLVEHTGTFIP
jgi:hypothetical protein